MSTNPSLDIAILADDLTSAADGAAPFVSRGQRAAIGKSRCPNQNMPVLAVDVASRSATAAQAAEQMAQATKQLASRHLLYKTVDSTLRGHVTVELEACFHASGRKTLVLAPAFPAAGRTTVNGIQLVDGIPVSETAYGRDPVHPARHSALTDLIPASISNVVLLDATTQEQLDTQVAAIPNPETVLWVGSPGMAIALAKRFSPDSSEQPIAATDSGILVAVGSANPRSHCQADAITHLQGVTLLRSPTERQANPATVLEHIAQQAVHVLRTEKIGAVIATGGDTMEAILNQLGVHEFEILQELDPGFPLGRVTLSNGQPLLIAMKAGGFGDDEVLLRAATRLRTALPTSNKVFS